MKKVDLYLRKNKIKALIFVLIGLSASIASWVGRADGRFKSFSGVGIAFTFVGVFTFFMYKFGGKKEPIRKTLIAENDELAKKMQLMAAARTYWIVFWGVAISCWFSSFIQIELELYIVGVLGFMAITWFGCIIYYSKKIF